MKWQIHFLLWLEGGTQNEKRYFLLKQSEWRLFCITYSDESSSATLPTLHFSSCLYPIYNTKSAYLEKIWLKLQFSFQLIFVGIFVSKDKQMFASLVTIFFLNGLSVNQITKEINLTTSSTQIFFGGNTWSINHEARFMCQKSVM